MKISIINYNAGNVQSVLFAMKRLGVEAILTDDFEVDPNFDWNQPLADLNQKFSLLGYLADLETALSHQTDGKVRLVGKINVLIHSPNDLLAELNR